VARGERVVLVARRADRLDALARDLGGEPVALEELQAPGRMPTMTADEVVQASLGGLGRGRVRVVAGWANRLLGFVVQRLAHGGSRGGRPGSSIAPVAGESPDMIPRSPRGRERGAFRRAGATRPLTTAREE